VWWLPTADSESTSFSRQSAVTSWWHSMLRALRWTPRSSAMMQDDVGINSPPAHTDSIRNTHSLLFHAKSATNASLHATTCSTHPTIYNEICTVLIIIIIIRFIKRLRPWLQRHWWQVSRGYYSKALRNKYVLSRDLKTDSESTLIIASGNEFQF